MIVECKGVHASTLGADDEDCGRAVCTVGAMTRWWCFRAGPHHGAHGNRDTSGADGDHVQLEAA